jgi:signal transduction histidine kinase
LAGFADQAAIAVQNAQHYAEAQELAALRERQRLARDLHDAVTQTLWSASLIAEVLPDQWEHDPEKGRQRLERLNQLTRGALAEMRTLLLELRPTSLLEAKFEELLDYLVKAAASRSRAEIHLQTEGEYELPPPVRVALYRICQEALNNVIQHAHASRVDILVNGETDAIQLTIQDDGVGFNLEQILGGHLGLKSMRERAESIGAVMQITGEPDRGTTISVNWSA